MRSLLNTVILIGVAGLTQAAVASPLIVNGGFDSNANGWTASGGCAQAAWIASGNGTGAMNLNSCGEDNTDPAVSQVVSGLVVGHTYTLAWDERLSENFSGAGFGKSFGVFLDGDGGTPLLTNEYLNFSWESVSTTFVATSTSQQITFAAELDPRTAGVILRTDIAYALDNVSLKDANVPEPASVTLIGLGLAGLAACRRKNA